MLWISISCHFDKEIMGGKAFWDGYKASQYHTSRLEYGMFDDTTELPLSSKVAGEWMTLHLLSFRTLCSPHEISVICIYLVLKPMLPLLFLALKFGAQPCVSSLQLLTLALAWVVTRSAFRSITCLFHIGSSQTEILWLRSRSSTCHIVFWRTQIWQKKKKKITSKVL